MAPRDEEPVGYLGGDVEATDQNPYGTPSTDEGEVEGYLEGAAGEEELPMLPPQESQGSQVADYSASDFIQHEEPAEEAQDPYQDYQAPSEEDASYFDSMGHEGPSTVTEEAPPEEAVEGDDQPKTISQQDAESIIKRITTKRIVPPEGEGRPIQSYSPPPMTRSGGGFRSGALLLIVGSILGLAVVAVSLFGNEIGKALYDNGYRDIAMGWPFNYQPPPVEDPVHVVVEPPEVRKKREMLETIRRSERVALGVKDDPKPGGAQTPGAPGSPAPGGTGTQGGNQ
jgi:hypothetical protein